MMNQVVFLQDFEKLIAALGLQPSTKTLVGKTLAIKWAVNPDKDWPMDYYLAHWQVRETVYRSVEGNIKIVFHNDCWVTWYWKTSIWKLWYKADGKILEEPCEVEVIG